MPWIFIALLGCSSPASTPGDAALAETTDAATFTGEVSSTGANGQSPTGGSLDAGAPTGATTSSMPSAGTGVPPGAAASGSQDAGPGGGSSGSDGMPPTDAPMDAGDPDAGAAARCDPATSRAHRELVALALRELFVDKDISAVDRYWADPYLQHNPIANSGVATFRRIMGSVVASPSFRYEPLLTLGDCDLVVALGRYSQTGVIFDMFRVRDDKLMEHWDSDTNQASSVSQLPALDEAAATAESRALFAELSSVVLVGGDTSRASEFFSPSYVEHHGAGATGPEAFVDSLQAESVSYAKAHHIIADGNYVFAISEGARGSEPFAFYDLFRVEAGKLAEHWDSRRAVPSSTASGLPIF